MRFNSFALARRSFTVVVVSLAFVLSVDPPLNVAAAESNAVQAALDSITRSELRSHVAVLADDTFEGREAGARGGHAAGGYLVKQLQALGLQPAGEQGSYYQTFHGNCRNVLALLEGSDAALKQEVVLIGGHYDHVGYGTPRNSYGPTGYIHNGADDNASGVSGLLEVAQALCQLPTRPRRTIVFAFWDGEEKGLLGSKHWVASPTLDWSRLKCFVNVDMIGRLANRRLEVYGSRSAAGLRQLVSQANRPALDLDFTWQMKDDSDHWPFFARELPVLMFHTGLHTDYHRPSDDAERLNHEGLEQVSRILFETTYALANTEQQLVFRPEAKRETNDVRRLREQPAPAPLARLGMTWRKEPSAADTPQSLRVLTVTPGSAAEQAGIHTGDFVVQFNGEPIHDDQAFRQQILASPVDITLGVQRGNDPLQQLAVPLRGQPIRVGVICREDVAEPGVAMITHVVFGSPAAQANLQLFDRIDAVDGRTFRNLAEFYALLDQSGETIVLRRERRGEIREVPLQLLPAPAPSP
jgi:hypothetical protein